MHLWDVERQVVQGMELNETFFLVFLGPDLMGMGDGGTPDAALGLLHFLEAEALLVLLLLLLLLFLTASAASLLSRSAGPPARMKLIDEDALAVLAAHDVEPEPGRALGQRDLARWRGQ